MSTRSVIRDTFKGDVESAPDDRNDSRSGCHVDPDWVNFDGLEHSLLLSEGVVRVSQINMEDR